MQLGSYCPTGYIPAFSCCCYMMTNGGPVFVVHKTAKFILVFLHMQERRVFGGVSLLGGLESLFMKDSKFVTT